MYAVDDFYRGFEAKDRYFKKKENVKKYLDKYGYQRNYTHYKKSYLIGRYEYYRKYYGKEK